MWYFSSKRREIHFFRCANLRVSVSLGVLPCRVRQCRWDTSGEARRRRGEHYSAPECLARIMRAQRFSCFLPSPLSSLGCKILKYSRLRVKVKRGNVHTVRLRVLRIDEIGWINWNFLLGVISRWSAEVKENWAFVFTPNILNQRGVEREVKEWRQKCKLADSRVCTRGFFLFAFVVWRNVLNLSTFQRKSSCFLRKQTGRFSAFRYECRSFWGVRKRRRKGVERSVKIAQRGGRWNAESRWSPCRILALWGKRTLFWGRHRAVFPKSVKRWIHRRGGEYVIFQLCGNRGFLRPIKGVQTNYFP